MKPVQIKPDIFWVGAVDWAARDFHGYVIPNGTTYNNYLVRDEHPTLVDTVKSEFADEALEGLRGLIDPALIRNVIVNHIENDHLGALDRVMALCPEAAVYTTERGKKGMARFFDISRWDVRTVKSGDEIATGRYTLRFVETPMLHWPDSMVTWVKEAGLLISQDAFGQHYASAARFDDEFVRANGLVALEDAVIDYYANILMPFGNLIRTTLGQLEKLGIAPDMIAPDHGVIWRGDPGRVLKLYRNLVDGKADRRVTVVYDTMWKGTEMMTRAIAQGIMDEGVDCVVLKMRATPMSVAVKEIAKSRGMLLGSPTLNNDIFPSMAGFAAYLRGLRPRDRVAGAYGCYGWGGGAVKRLTEELKGMKLEVVEPGIEVHYRPSAEDRERCYAFGRQFAARVKEYHRKYE